MSYKQGTRSNLKVGEKIPALGAGKIFFGPPTFLVKENLKVTLHFKGNVIHSTSHVFVIHIFASFCMDEHVTVPYLKKRGDTVSIPSLLPQYNGVRGYNPRKKFGNYRCSCEFSCILSTELNTLVHNVFCTSHCNFNQTAYIIWTEIFCFLKKYLLL
jgi:hypothetical protein